MYSSRPEVREGRLEGLRGHRVVVRTGAGRLGQDSGARLEEQVESRGPFGSAEGSAGTAGREADSAGRKELATIELHVRRLSGPRRELAMVEGRAVRKPSGL